MQKAALISLLNDLGLTENEAAVYLASLSSGPSTVAKVAKQAGIKRTTTYSVMETLKAKGLLRTEVKGLKQSFVAESPEKLELMLEQRRERLRKALPEFEALQKLTGGESFIKYYEGLPGIESVYSQVLKELRPGDEYLVYSDLDQWTALDPEFFQKFIEKRAKLKLKIRLLLQDSPSAREFKKFEKNYNVKIKILPPGTELTTDAMILPHKMAIHQLAAPTLMVVVENQSIIKMQRELFEIIWQSLK